MTDNEIRGYLLKRYYERRREGMVSLTASEFGGSLSDDDIKHVSVQLLEHGLIGGRKLEALSEGLIAVMARITAEGIDVVEGTARAPITVTFEDKSVQVTGSQGVVIGNGNTLTLTMQMERLVQAIDHSSAPDPEKREAKSMIQKLLAHPLVAAVAPLVFSGSAQ